MKKIFLFLLQVCFMFASIGCTSTINHTQIKEPISVTIQQYGAKQKLIKITDKDDFNQILNCIKSIKWTSGVSVLSNKQVNDIIIFQYKAYSKDNKLSDDNPYKVWINGDKSVTFESFSGKVGTISKEEMTKYELIFKYLDTK